MKTRDQPKRIRVLGQYYTLEPVTAIDEEDDSLAQVDPATRKLRYVQSTDEEVLKEAIFHELIHLGERMIAIPEEYITEEQVMRIGYIVFSILRDNPKLSAWLLEEDV